MFDHVTELLIKTVASDEIPWDLTLTGHYRTISREHEPVFRLRAKEERLVIDIV